MVTPLYFDPWRDRPVLCSHPRPLPEEKAIDSPPLARSTWRASGLSCRALATGLCLVLVGCFSAPPAHPYTVRLEARGTYNHAGDGFVRFEEEAPDETIVGTRLSLDKDLDLEPAFGWGAVVALRMSNDDELTAGFQQIDGFEGSANVEVDSLLGDLGLISGERIRSELLWNRADLAYGRRVFAMPEESPVALDVVLEGGFELDHVLAEIESSAGDERRELVGGAPFIGSELRLGFLERFVVFGGLRLGYLDVGDTRLAILNGTAGLRVRVFGPLDLSLYGEAGERSGSHKDGDERFEFELSHQLLGIGVGLAF